MSMRVPNLSRLQNMAMNPIAISRRMMMASEHKVIGAADCDRSQNLQVTVVHPTKTRLKFRGVLISCLHGLCSNVSLSGVASTSQLEKYILRLETVPLLI